MHISEHQLQDWAKTPDRKKLQEIYHMHDRIQTILKQELPVVDLKKQFKLDKFDYEVYLEGAYANGTNTTFEDMPKIVVQLDSIFWADRTQLSEHESRQYSNLHNDSEYKWHLFKQDVLAIFAEELGKDKVEENKNGLVVQGLYHSSVQVIVACQYRLYKKFISYDTEHFIEGIKFFTSSNDEEVTYFPKVHLRNCEAKDRDTEGKFKETIRIYKNLRNSMHEKGIFDKHKAPSYFIESLLYNCSDHCFSGTYTHCMLQSLQYIFDAMLSGRIAGFISADEQELLVGETTWNLEDVHQFMGLLADFYLQPEQYSFSASV